MDIELSPSASSWLESPSYGGFRIWHIIFLSFGAFLGCIIMLCCCFRFRIPRTKQDIEADFRRKKITRKFRERLACIQNSDMDEMDLKKALERMREDFDKENERKLRGGHDLICSLIRIQK